MPQNLTQGKPARRILTQRILTQRNPVVREKPFKPFSRFKGSLVQSAFKTILLSVLGTAQCILLAQSDHILTSSSVLQYSRVAILDTCNSTIELADSNPFKPGDRASLCQMGGAEFDTSISGSFGKLTALNSAGCFEYISIRSVNGLTCSYTTPLVNAYNSAGIIQLCSVIHGRIVAVDSTLIVPHFNGTLGGCLFIDATDTLIINASILANGSGFEGGLPSVSGWDTSRTESVFSDLAGASGYRGGTIGATHARMSTGRNSLCTGGGGGNARNSGGGGGGNGGQGGLGGNQTNEFPVLKIGGIGGESIPPTVTLGRIFLGGGGGGGHQNDFLGGAGGAGGGVVVIRSKFIAFGDQVSIEAIGADGQDSRDDGAGGAGAGGSIIIEAENTNGIVVVDVHGGNGGRSLGTINCFGPGGGGGGGIVQIQQSAASALFAIRNGGKSGTTISSNALCGSTSAYGAEPGTTGVIHEFLEPLSIQSKRSPLHAFVASDTVCEDSYDTIVIVDGRLISFDSLFVEVNSDRDTIVIGPLTESLTLSLVIQKNNGCLLTDTLRLTVMPLPDVQLTVGDTTVPSALDSITIQTTKPHTRYLWSNGSTAESIQVSGNSEVWVTCWNAEGCSATSDTIRVRVLRVAGDILLDVGDVQGRAGEIVAVPIEVTMRDTLTANTIIHFRLATNASTLNPEGNSAIDPGDSPAFISSVTTGLSSSTWYRLLLSSSIPSTLKLKISMRCALGNSEVSTVEIDSVETDPNAIQTTIGRSGQFTLLDVCKSGSRQRLFDPIRTDIAVKSVVKPVVKIPRCSPDCSGRRDGANDSKKRGERVDVVVITYLGTVLTVESSVCGEELCIDFPLWYSGLALVGIHNTCCTSMESIWIVR